LQRWYVFLCFVQLNACVVCAV